MADIVVSKVDEMWMHIKCDRGIAYELNDHFSYFAEGYKFMPRFKDGVWDGKIRLFNTASCQLYYGLLPDVKKFAEKYNYELDVLPSVRPVDITSRNLSGKITLTRFVDIILMTTRCSLSSAHWLKIRR